METGSTSLLAAALLAAATLAAPAAMGAPPAAPPVGEPPGALALTISGGVSLGNYEAGVTWAVVRFLRSPISRSRLAAVTGSSAGSINALLAAAMYCEAKDEARDDLPDGNLFHDTWTPVGADELLPAGPAGYGADDALLSALPLERSLERVRATLFRPGGRRFRPGCDVPVGVTVTRDEPELREVSGLQAKTQRFVVPLHFQVDEAGAPLLVRATIPPDRETAASALVLGEAPGAGVGPLQASLAVLASGAFPLAFRARPLCDCALACPEEDRVVGGVCDGPDAAHPISGLSCASVPPFGERQLCRRRYVDGAIFDTLPVGLAIDLAESFGPPLPPLSPLVYLVVDPDFRRHAPMEEAPTRRDTGLVGPLQLFSNLVGTARTSELGRAISRGGWERNTQKTLADAAAFASSLTQLQEEMRRIAGADQDTSGIREELFRTPGREALGPFLRRCMQQLSAGSVGRFDGAALFTCAEALRSGAAAKGEGRRLSIAEVVALSGGLAALIDPSARRNQQIFGALTGPEVSLADRLPAMAAFRDRVTIAVAAFRFLAGEVPILARSGMLDAELRRVRRDLLGVVRGADRMVRSTEGMLRTVLGATLAEEAGTLPPDVLERAHAALGEGAAMWSEGEALPALGHVSGRVGALLALAGRLSRAGPQAAQLARSAELLGETDVAERRLVLSRRFSPLTGSSLLWFSAFLDRGLRELDFHLGVYDTAMQVAGFLCSTQGPYERERTAPDFLAGDPAELDFSSLETQRCVGEALRGVAAELQLSTSPHAELVLATLAPMELAAALGAQARATGLLAEPSWSWLPRPATSTEAFSTALATVLSRRQPCAPGAAEQLCPRDLGFTELVDGLRERGYPTREPAMLEVLADQGHWTGHLVSKLVDRSATLELQPAARSKRPAAGALLIGLGVGELWSRRSLSIRRSPRLAIDPSTVPDQPLPTASPLVMRVAHLVPYRVSLDVAQGGIALSWLEPSLRLSPALSLDSVADLLDVDGGSGRVASTVGLLATLRLGDPALSFGARLSLPWNGDPVLSPGLFGRFALLQDRFAISFGVRSLHQGQRGPFVALSVSDLNGLAYWLSPWAASN